MVQIKIIIWNIEDSINPRQRPNRLPPETIHNLVSIHAITSRHPDSRTCHIWLTRVLLELQERGQYIAMKDWKLLRRRNLAYLNRTLPVEPHITSMI